MALPRPVESAGLSPCPDKRAQPVLAPAVLSEFAGQGTRTRPQQRSWHRERRIGHGQSWLCRGLWSRQGSYRDLTQGGSRCPLLPFWASSPGKGPGPDSREAGTRRVESATDKHGSAAAFGNGRAPTAI